MGYSSHDIHDAVHMKINKKEHCIKTFLNMLIVTQEIVPAI
jgi:hypothetical protein